MEDKNDERKRETSRETYTPHWTFPDWEIKMGYGQAQNSNFKSKMAYIIYKFIFMNNHTETWNSGFSMIYKGKIIPKI